MDLMNRGVRPSQPTSSPAGGPSQPAQHPSGKTKSGKFGKFRPSNFLNVAYIALLFSVTVVIIGVLAALVISDNNSKEGGLVDKNKFQAVFLNNGQVYFGNIADLNENYVSMGNIYYLRVNQQVQPGQQASQNDVSLVKLGCELHGPEDAMVINREQVTFWENLKSDGQVTKAIAEYVKANPNGQDCAQQQNTGSGESTSTEGGSESTNSTNSSTGTGTSTGNTTGTTPSTPTTGQ